MEEIRKTINSIINSSEMSNEDKRKELNEIEKNNPQSLWEIADKIINKVYPGWSHIPNKGILRGTIARAIKTCKYGK